MLSVSTMIAPAPPSAFRSVQRQLATLLPSERWTDAPPALELSSIAALEAPRLMAASIIEGKTLQPHAIIGAPEPHFRAFLDGTQTSRAIAHVDAIPIVFGSVAAVIRDRVDRRMRTWESPRLRHAIYAPLPLLPDEWKKALGATNVRVVDTLERRKAESLHPFVLQDAAVHAVQEDREAVERELAERWCEPRATGGGTLFVDGAITGSEVVAQSPLAVGVIKSHRTLYAGGEDLRCVLRLAAGARTSVFRITSPRRTPVASWYLRLREPNGHDPLWGLVRVEIAEERGATSGKVAKRANEVSRWVLAETLPLSVPDGRWDKMVYGIRDCEEFLRAIQ
jgi:hypothetical protein